MTTPRERAEELLYTLYEDMEYDGSFRNDDKAVDLLLSYAEQVREECAVIADEFHEGRDPENSEKLAVMLKCEPTRAYDLLTGGQTAAQGIARAIRALSAAPSDTKGE